MVPSFGRPFEFEGKSNYSNGSDGAKITKSDNHIFVIFVIIAKITKMGIFKLKIAIKCFSPRPHAFYHYF